MSESIDVYQSKKFINTLFLFLYSFMLREQAKMRNITITINFILALASEQVMLFLIFYVEECCLYLKYMNKDKT